MDSVRNASMARSGQTIAGETQPLAPSAWYGNGRLETCMSEETKEEEKRSEVRHPVLTNGKKIDLVETYKRIAKRFPKVMARLAK